MAEIHVDIPDKMPGEGPATDKQRLKIMQVAPGFPDDLLRDLGKIQASKLLDQMIPEYERETQRQLMKQKLLFFGIPAVILVLLVARCAM